VATRLGIKLSGWHDFRRSLATNLRRQGTHPKIVSAILGHSRVQLAPDTYDLASTEELAAPLALICGELNPTEPKVGDAA
jgi:integrase